MSEYPTRGSVTRWIHDLKQGDTAAVEPLLERYFGRLRQLARMQLSRGTRAVLDDEDVALSVLESVCRNAANGKLPDLRDRDDLWFMMIAISQNKVISQRRYENTAKRGAGKVLTMTDALEQYNTDLEGLMGSDVAPEFFTEVMDCWNQLLRSLPDDKMRRIAQLRLEGHTNQVIAERLQLLRRTVERKVELIRELWTKLNDEEHRRRSAQNKPDATATTENIDG